MKIIILITLSLCLNIISYAQEQSIIKPFELGEVHQIDSRFLNEERTINVYLPEGYDVSHKEMYPVVYLLDGSKDEDFIHTVGLVQYNTFPWVNRMPKSIVVGIANIDRKRDFTFLTQVEDDKKEFPTAGHSSDFIEFLENELKPYINTTFKTNGYSTIIGQSLGGLLATEVLIKHPKMFNYYIIISPSIWWDGKSILNKISGLKDQVKKEKLKVYIGVGKEGHTKGNNSPLMEDDAQTLYKRISTIKGIQSTFDYLPEENHATVGHQALMNAFTWLYSK